MNEGDAYEAMNEGDGDEDGRVMMMMTMMTMVMVMMMMMMMPMNEGNAYEAWPVAQAILSLPQLSSSDLQSVVQETR